MAHAENILTLTYDFLLYLIPQLSKFPRDQKFLLADRMQTLAHEILDDFVIIRKQNFMGASDTTILSCTFDFDSGYVPYSTRLF